MKLYKNFITILFRTRKGFTMKYRQRKVVIGEIIGRSFRYNKIRIWARIEPCGTPVQIYLADDRLLFILTLSKRFCKKDLKLVVPAILVSYIVLVSREKISLWCTVSNAFLRSKNIYIIQILQNQTFHKFFLSNL